MNVADPSNTGSPPPDTVVAQIMAQAPNLQVAEAMLLGSSFEGGWGPSYAVGDYGTSFGPFQMHEGGALTSSGLTPSQAQDPALAVKAMLPSYEAGVSRVPQGLWSSDPALAAEQAAVAAERPARSYLDSYGQSALNQHWASVTGALNGSSLPATGGTNATLTDFHIPGTGITIPTSPGSIGKDAFNAMFGQGAIMRVVLVIIGIILLAIGVDALVKPKQGPTDIIVSAPGTLQGQGQALNRGATGKSFRKGAASQRKVFRKPDTANVASDVSGKKGPHWGKPAADVGKAAEDAGEAAAA